MAPAAAQPAFALRWLAAAALIAVILVAFSGSGSGGDGGAAQQAQHLLASVRRQAPPPPLSAAEAEALALLASATSTATPTPTPTPTPTTTTTPSHSPRGSALREPALPPPPPPLLLPPPTSPAPSASQAPPPSPSAPPPPSPQPAPPAPRVFWTSDLHDGTRCDTATTLAVGLGQQVILGGHKHHRAAHPSCLNGVRWPRRPYSELILSHESHNHYIAEEEVRANFEYYKDDADMAEVDAFYCEFPMSFCEAWLPFNKTVIYLAGHRFSLARCSQPQVSRLIEHLLQADARGHIVASATTYDAAYINYFTGLKPLVLRYSALFYASWRQFPAPPAAAMRSEILVGPLQRESVLFGAEIAAATGGRFAFATAHQLYGHFELQHLVAHRAAVLFPYTAHTSFGIVELYALGIPIFVPSPEFLLQLGIVDDRLMTSGDYCGPGAWFAPRHPQSLHGPNPESAAPEDALYWFRLAEFYQLPLITTFSSFQDLGVKLEAAGDFAELRGAVARRLEQWEGELLAQWRELVERVPKGRAVPRSYEEALRLVMRAGSVQAQ